MYIHISYNNTKHIHTQAHTYIPNFPLFSPPPKYFITPFSFPNLSFISLFPLHQSTHTHPHPHTQKKDLLHSSTPPDRAFNASYHHQQTITLLPPSTFPLISKKSLMTNSSDQANGSSSRRAANHNHLQGPL